MWRYFMECKKCKYWNKITETKYSIKMGRCSKLSANENEDYPNENITGIEGMPLCSHDGGISEIETKEWFGCVHFNATQR